jgi:hypothetical protein
MLGGRFGIRVFAQDTMRRSRVVGAFGTFARTIHEPALQFGLKWD